MADRRHRVLILGGTAEARALAERLAAHPAITPLTSLAGRTADPVMPPGGVRSGGFGGAEAMASYLASARIAAVVDATHPFAARITGQATQAAAVAAVPLIRLERPAWQPRPGDRWTIVPDGVSAAAATPAATRVFLAIGRQDLAPFETVDRAWFLLRVVDPPESPLMQAAHHTVVARGPFALADETALLQRHRVALIVAKNSGGHGSAAKLTAARALGLPVIMIARPPVVASKTASTPAPVVETVEQAWSWLTARLRRPHP